MGNSIKKEYDRLSITKDIAERQNIIRQFQITGFLARNDAIKKIESIQVTDADLALATIAKQAQSGSVDLNKVDNNLIIANVQFQIDFLTAKLAKLELEEKENG